jgi:hypothetical protein
MVLLPFIPILALILQNWSILNQEIFEYKAAKHIDTEVSW